MLTDGDRANMANDVAEMILDDGHTAKIINLKAKELQPDWNPIFKEVTGGEPLYDILEDVPVSIYEHEHLTESDSNVAGLVDSGNIYCNISDKVVGLIVNEFTLIALDHHPPNMMWEVDTIATNIGEYRLVLRKQVGSTSIALPL